MLFFCFFKLGYLLGLVEIQLIWMVAQITLEILVLQDFNQNPAGTELRNSKNGNPRDWACALKGALDKTEFRYRGTRGKHQTSLTSRKTMNKPRKQPQIVK